MTAYAPGRIPGRTGSQASFLGSLEYPKLGVKGDDATGDKGALQAPRKLGGRESVRAGVIFVALLSLSLLWVWLTFSMVPDPRALATETGVDPDTVMLKIPRSFEQLRQVRNTLELYRGHYLLNIIILYTSLYLLLQSFMIPGCFFLNILVGAVLPLIPALLYITVLTTVGCTLNFLMSQNLFACIVVSIIPQQIQSFQQQVAAHRDHLFYYMMCLRIVPMLPAWVVNIACPFARVPLRDFVLATTVGFQPQLIILVQAGQAVGSLESMHDLYSWKIFAAMIGFCVLALLPVIAKRVLPAGWLHAKSPSKEHLTSPSAAPHGEVEIV